MVSLERRISSLEDDELEVMGRIEDAQRDLDQLDAQITNIDEQLVTLRESSGGRTAEIDGELGELDAKRAPLVADAADDLLALYEKVRKNRNGVGAAELRQGRCTGCQLKIDNAELEVIRKSPEDWVIRCEECTRILVRTPESGL